MIAALFVEDGGAYFGLSDVDPWPESRDARRYAGPHPVVAHPPCNHWSQMNNVNAKRYGFKINEDGGCFASALASVRRWGRVLEHPAETRAFRHHGIPRPIRGWTRTLAGDWICEVNQAAYGHRATKRTWLLYCGRGVPPMLNFSDIRGTHQIGGFDMTKPALPKRERAATPPVFRQILIDIARSAR